MPADESKWNGSFDPQAYEAARSVLEQDRARAEAEVRSLLLKRARHVGVVAAAWAVCSVAMALANPDLLLVAEIGWTLIVIGAVVRLIPAFMGRGNLGELFDQYEARLSDLESAHVPLPAPSDMPDLVAALDLVSLPGE